jgi:hypothetical protein
VAGPTAAAPCWSSAINRNSDVLPPCCCPAMKPTGRSKRAHCGGSPTGFGDKRRKRCCAPSCDLV